MIRVKNGATIRIKISLTKKDYEFLKSESIRKGESMSKIMIDLLKGVADERE